MDPVGEVVVGEVVEVVPGVVLTVVVVVGFGVVVVDGSGKQAFISTLIRTGLSGLTLRTISIITLYA